jgi:predicted DNA-binding transcriptional regulator AlpA
MTHTLNPEPILLDAAAASRMLSISRRQLFRISSPHGALPVIKLGRLSRWDVEDIREFVAKKKRQPRNDTTAM